jgi:hypothetical protein
VQISQSVRVKLLSRGSAPAFLFDVVLSLMHACRETLRDDGSNIMCYERAQRARISNERAHISMQSLKHVAFNQIWATRFKLLFLRMSSSRNRFPLSGDML